MKTEQKKGHGHSCANCGACDQCERCDHCGYCRKCGRYIVMPYQPWVTVPIYPWPIYPTPSPWPPPIYIGAVTGSFGTLGGEAVTWSSDGPVTMHNTLMLTTGEIQ